MCLEWAWRDWSLLLIIVCSVWFALIRFSKHLWVICIFGDLGGLRSELCATFCYPLAVVMEIDLCCLCLRYFVCVETRQYLLNFCEHILLKPSGSRRMWSFAIGMRELLTPRVVLVRSVCLAQFWREQLLSPCSFRRQGVELLRSEASFFYALFHRPSVPFIFFSSNWWRKNGRSSISYIFFSFMLMVDKWGERTIAFQHYITCLHLLVARCVQLEGFLSIASHQSSNIPDLTVISLPRIWLILTFECL